MEKIIMMGLGALSSSSFTVSTDEKADVNDVVNASHEDVIQNTERPQGSKVALVGTRVALLMLGPGSVLAARPLKELWAHVRNGFCPSWHLIARCIKVLVLAIFRWHFCDFAMLATVDALAVSLPKHENKKSFALDQLDQLDEHYRFILENAYVYKFKHTDDLELPQHNSSDRIIHISGDTFLKPLEFDKYEEINPQTIWECYSDCYGYKITPKQTGNTLSDLFKSKNLELKA